MSLLRAAVGPLISYGQITDQRVTIYTDNIQKPQ